MVYSVNNAGVNGMQWSDGYQDSANTRIETMEKQVVLYSAHLRVSARFLACQLHDAGGATNGLSCIELAHEGESIKTKEYNSL